MSQVLTARYVPLMWVFPISVIELRRSLELGPNMQGRNSEDLLSELEEIKQENQKKMGWTWQPSNFRKLWRNVFQGNKWSTGNIAWKFLLQVWLKELSRAHEKSEFRAPCARTWVLLSSLFRGAPTWRMSYVVNLTSRGWKPRNCSMCVVICL